MINPGKYKHKITICSAEINEDCNGFAVSELAVVLTTYADVKTTKGYTLIVNGTDFESAYTNFTIRYPRKEITRDMLIKFKGKTYKIEYLNNINEENTELEIQAREVTK